MEQIEPAHNQLNFQAVQGEVLYNDDTTARIRELMGKRAEETLTEGSADGSADDKKSGRRGLFTSGIVSTSEGRQMALFFTGRQHAGENLADVLRRRVAELDAPMQMCDALSRRPSVTPAVAEAVLCRFGSACDRRAFGIGSSQPPL